MDFRFASEQEQFRDSVRRFAEKHLAARARSSARTRPSYPWDVARLMAKQGLLGITMRKPTAGRAAA